MDTRREKLRLAAISLLCLSSIGFGFYARELCMILSGAAGIVYAGAAMRRLSTPAAPVDAEAQTPEVAHA